MSLKPVYKRGHWQSENWYTTADGPAYKINDRTVMVVINPHRWFEIPHGMDLINYSEALDIAKKLEIFWS